MATIIITVPPGAKIRIQRGVIPEKKPEKRKEKTSRKILRYTWIFIKSFFRASIFVLRIFFWFVIALGILLAVSGGDRC